jgi:hypothetical protein
MQFSFNLVIQLFPALSIFPCFALVVALDRVHDVRQCTAMLTTGNWIKLDMLPHVPAGSCTRLQCQPALTPGERQQQLRATAI